VATVVAIVIKTIVGGGVLFFLLHKYFKLVASSSNLNEFFKDFFHPPKPFFLADSQLY
jgi:hypothetical protein